MWINDYDIFNLNEDWDGDIENIEYKVNEYLKLRLEDDRANVYINNKKV